jgi:citronellyl-CoA dehydrogenase
VIFTEEHDAFRRTVRAVVQREIDPHVDAWEEARIFPAHELFPKLGRAGLLGLEYDPAYGGQGADHSYSVVFGEELGRINCNGVPMAIAVQTDMATPSLAAFGSEDLKQRYLVPAIRGDAVCSIAVTEPDAGSDVAALRTRAVRDGEEWVINGTKLYITNGTQADWLCLLVRTSDEGGHRGMSQLVFPTDAPGFSVSRKLRKLGNWSSDTAELSFVDARIPVSNTIGEIGRGFQQQMQQFQKERTISLYIGTGQMAHALERTAEYLSQRHAFGKPLLANQHLQYQLAELEAKVDMFRHYTYAGAEAYLHGQDTSKFVTVGKLMLGRLQRELADTCLQYHGGVGYMEETWVSRYFRDSRLVSIGGGADEVMLKMLSRSNGWPEP